MEFEGSHSQESTEWREDMDEFVENKNPWNYLVCEGHDAILVRRFQSVLKMRSLPGLPSEATVQKTVALFHQTDDVVRVKVVSRSIGTPYCDSNQCEEIWDFVSQKDGEATMVR